MLAAGLRNWQRRCVSRRIPLKNLAQNLKTTTKVLENMMRSGPRSSTRKATGKKKLLKEAKKRCVFVKDDRLSRSKRTAVAALRAAKVHTIGLRQAQRTLRKIRLERVLSCRKYWKEWHRKNPNRGIDQDGLDQLNYFSLSILVNWLMKIHFFLCNFRGLS